ncbi:hypothetical protein HDF11_000188 [Tunturiibacter psychrotolerans]
MRARNQSGDLSPMMFPCLAGYFGGEIYARAFSRRYPDTLNHRNNLRLKSPTLTHRAKLHVRKRVFAKAGVV